MIGEKNHDAALSILNIPVSQVNKQNTIAYPTPSMEAMVTYARWEDREESSW